MKIDIPNDRPTLLRVKSSGQIQEFIPSVARAMLAGGSAQLVDRKTGEIIETAQLNPSTERAVAPSAQKEEPRKPEKPKTRSAR